MKGIQSNSDTEEEAELEEENLSSVTRLTLLPSPFHLPRNTSTTSENMSDLSITDEEKLKLAGKLFSNRNIMGRIHYFLYM